MMAPGPGDVAELRSIISGRLGLAIDEDRDGQMADVLLTRSRPFGTTRAYLDALARGDIPRDEFDAYAEVLTVGETFFFRNASQFAVLSRLALPARVAAREGARINILSIGCASGEEPYTIAMVARESVPAPEHIIAIRAVDVNRLVLEKARTASYSNWSLRNTGPHHRAQWFRQSAGRFTLSDSIRGAVKFEQGNLAADDESLWPPSHYDIVFCRNVLMYFEPEAARAAVARIANALVPGGFLFLGEAETLRGLSSAFDMCHTHGAFYYQRSGRSSAAAVAPPVHESVDMPAALWPADWMETIRAASERIGEIARDGPRELASEPDLSDARELIQNERFVEALDRLALMSPQTSARGDVLLLRAVSLVHAGDFDGGEATCRELLGRDGLSAGAHYLLALCHEGRGRLDLARHHNEIALHLDPTFSMAQLRLGLLAREAGDMVRAQGLLTEALTALDREELPRILLFGGGFGRHGLVSLCRGAIAACKSTPAA